MVGPVAAAVKFDVAKTPAGVTSAKFDAETDAGSTASLKPKSTQLTAFITRPVGDCDSIWKLEKAPERRIVPPWPDDQPPPPRALVVPAKLFVGV